MDEHWKRNQLRPQHLNVVLQHFTSASALASASSIIASAVATTASAEELQRSSDEDEIETSSGHVGGEGGKTFWWSSECLPCSVLLDDLGLGSGLGLGV